MSGTVEQKVFFPIMRAIGIVSAAILLLLMVGVVVFALISNSTGGGEKKSQVTFEMVREQVNKWHPTKDETSPPQTPLTIPSILKKYYNTAERRQDLYEGLDPIYKTDTEKQEALKELSQIAKQAKKSDPDYAEQYLWEWVNLIQDDEGEAEKPHVTFEMVHERVNERYSDLKAAPKKALSVPFSLKKYINTTEHRQWLYERLDPIYKTDTEKKGALKELTQIVEQAKKLDKNHIGRYVDMWAWLNDPSFPSSPYASEQLSRDEREMQEFMNEYVQPIIDKIQPQIKQYVTQYILPPIVAGAVLFLFLLFTIVVVLLLLLSIERNTRVRREE